MAAIEKRGPAQWRAMVRKKGYPTVSKTFDTKAKAEAWAKARETEMNEGKWQDRREAEATTLAAALTRYYKEVTPTKKGAMQERRRINAWKRDALASRALTSIHGADIAVWRDRRLSEGKSPTTVRTDLALISHLYEVARKDWNMPIDNPVRSCRMPAAARGRDRRLIDDEEQRLLDATRDRPFWFQALVRLALATAMRRGEMLKLRWADISIRRRVAVLHDTKNGERRDVPLSRSARRALALARIYQHEGGRQDGRVFTATETMIAREWRLVRTATGIADLRIHDLRHEATSRLFEKGFNQMETATITGHKTLAMLRRYTHLRAEDLARRLD
ncbi:MAG: site-specific integrase [Clostridia bacterium]|nr:site-specific integrase [Clostridia bacterium]